MPKLKLLILFFSLILIPPAPLFAESITLKSGKKIEAKILERTKDYIKIEVGSSPVYYELKYVKSIEADTGPALVQEEESAPVFAATLYLRQGFKYASQAKLKEAGEEFKKGLKIYSGDHNLKEALRTLDELKAGAIKEDYALRLFKGSSLLLEAKFEQAKLEFQEALKLKPDDANLYYYLGICHYSLGQYPEAINYLKQAQLNLEDAELYYYLGAACYYLGRYQEALSYLEKAVALNPSDAQAYCIIGASNYSLGKVQEAKENLNKAKTLFQDKFDYLKAKDVEDFLTQIDSQP